MALETATYISQLVTANPTHTDGLDQADSHLRLLKSVLQNQFPNLGASAVTPTAAALNNVGTDGTVSAPGMAFTADATAGFYRPSTGHIGIVGRLQGNGAVYVGSMHWFPADPGTTIVARGGSAAGTEQFVEADGSTYPVTKFPDLAASGMVTVSGANFTVPLLTDTGRFVRSRNTTSGSTTTPGTAQSNQNAAHTHTATDSGHTHGVTDPQHSHGVTDPGHSHYITFLKNNGSVNAGAPVYNAAALMQAASQINVDDSTQTTGISINSASTDISINSGAANITVASTGGSEARPEAFVAMCVLKT